MKKFNIINGYILLGLLSPFVISLFFLTFVFLMTRIPQITNMVVNYNADILSIGLMIVYTLPKFMEFTIPMSVMLSVLLIFMRMAQDNEIVAIKGAGASLYELLPSVLIFCLTGVFLTMCITVFGVPWGKLSIKKKGVELAKTSIDAALQERQFNSQLDDVMIYVGHVDMKTKELKDVFIEDRRTKGVVTISVAPKGRIIQLENENIYTIKLYNGMINQVDIDDKNVSNIKFGDYNINIDLDSLNKTSGKIFKEFDAKSLVELIQYIKLNKAKAKGSAGKKENFRLTEALMEFHQKFSIPFACLSLGILAFPLGIQSSSLRKTSGFTLGISFFLLYYLLLGAGISLGESGNVSPIIVMWLPNIIMGGIGLFFLIKNANEEPVQFPKILTATFLIIKRRVVKIK